MSFKTILSEIGSIFKKIKIKKLNNQKIKKLYIPESLLFKGNKFALVYDYIHKWPKMALMRKWIMRKDKKYDKN